MQPWAHIAYRIGPRRGWVRAAHYAVLLLAAVNAYAAGTPSCNGGQAAAVAKAAAQVSAAPAMPSSATIGLNPYGPVSVSGATLVGATISNIQPGAVIQLGNVPGAAGSQIELNFQGFDIGAGNSLTFRSGAAGQSVLLWNVGTNESMVAGTLQAVGGNGAPAPYLILQNEHGVTIAPTGVITGTAGLQVSGLCKSWTIAQHVVNEGVVDGGPMLVVQGLRIGGGGAYKGDSIVLSTLTFANNPVNGMHFLDNGLQLYPGTGTLIDLTLHAYGSVSQVLNVFLHGDATVWMPSSWGAGSTMPVNNAVVPQGGARPPGIAEPAFGGGSMIVQALGSLQVVRAITNDFVFPGAIVLKAGATLDLNGVVINQGWTTSGQAFQGVFFEAPNIVSPAGNIQVLTNNLNWINFSTLPAQHVRTWSLAPDASGGASYVIADSFAPHLNTYSIAVETAANGGCWTCLVNPNVVNMY